MAVRKKKPASTRKAPTRKKTSARAGAKKKTASAGSKKTGARSGAKKAAASAGPAKTGESAGATKKAPSSRSGKTPERARAKDAASSAGSRKAPARGGASSRDVNLGHVFALRPRVPTSFRPDAFRRARQLLEEEAFGTLADAARAVAEKALELTREGAPAAPGRKGHR